MQLNHVSKQGYTPLQGEASHVGQTALSQQRAEAAADALVEQARDNDPALFAALKDILQMCKAQSLSFLQIMSRPGRSREVPLVALLQGKDKQALKLVF